MRATVRGGRWCYVCSNPWGETAQWPGELGTVEAEGWRLDSSGQPRGHTGLGQDTHTLRGSQRFRQNILG